MPAYSKEQQTGRDRPDPVVGMRKRSQKLAERLEDEYAPLRKRFLQTRKICEIKIRGRCTKFARDVHHKAGRTGAALTDESTFVACCRSCHTWVEEHSGRSTEARLDRAARGTPDVRERVYLYSVDWKREPRARPGDDVDTFIRREGPEALQRLIDNARPAGDVLIDSASDALGGRSDAFARSRVLRSLLGLVTGEKDPVVRNHYIRRLAVLGEVNESEIHKLAGLRPPPPKPTTGTPIYERPEYQR